MHDDDLLRQRLQGYASDLGRLADPPEPARLRHRGRRRARHHLVVLCAAVVAAVGVGASALPLPARAPDHPPGSAAPASTQPRGPATGPPPPSTYIAQPSANDRLAVVELRTGRVARWLGVEPEDDSFDLSGDRRTLLFQEKGFLPGTCMNFRWHAIDLTTGARRFSVLAHTVAMPDATRLVYTRDRDVGHRLYCASDIVVRNLRTGAERVWQGPAGLFIGGLAVSRDGRRVVWHAGRQDLPRSHPYQGMRLLDLERDRTMAQARPLPGTGGTTCAEVGREVYPMFTLANFHPVTGNILTVQTCQGPNPGEGVMPQLLEYDGATGRLLRRATIVFPGSGQPARYPGWISSMSIDPSGRHLLLQGPRDEVYTMHGDQVVVRPGWYRRPSW